MWTFTFFTKFCFCNGHVGFCVFVFLQNVVVTRAGLANGYASLVDELVSCPQATSDCHYGTVMFNCKQVQYFDRVCRSINELTVTRIGSGHFSRQLIRNRRRSCPQTIYLLHRLAAATDNLFVYPPLFPLSCLSFIYNYRLLFHLII